MPEGSSSVSNLLQFKIHAFLHSFFRLYVVDRAFALAFYLGLIWLLCSYSETARNVFDYVGSFAKHVPILGQFVPISNNNS